MLSSQYLEYSVFFPQEANIVGRKGVLTSSVFAVACWCPKILA